MIIFVVIIIIIMLTSVKSVKSSYSFKNWRKGGNCEALQLEGRPTSRQSFWALVTMPKMHQPTNSTLPQFSLDSATPISYNGTNILATGEHLPVFWP